VLVGITGFGSVWRHRLAKCDAQGRLGAPVYYNTTGISANNGVHQRPEICGYVRFDTIGGFDPHCLAKMTSRVFECAEPSVWSGCNKLLCRRILNSTAVPDSFVVVVKSRDVGRLPVGSDGWRSQDTWLISFSESREQQEAMLLMPIDGWIRATVGTLILRPSLLCRSRAGLELDKKE